jgi:F0F1-type ATP synthase membrane subunit b/b'
MRSKHMADLSLIPNPQVMAVQAGIFLANLYVVKKMFVEPYLELKDKRIRLTEGDKSQAGQILQECKVKAESIEENIKRAFAEADRIREEKRAYVLNQKECEINAAYLEANRYLKEKRETLNMEIKGELAKVNLAAEKLTIEVYQAVTS